MLCVEREYVSLKYAVESFKFSYKTAASFLYLGLRL